MLSLSGSLSISDILNLNTDAAYPRVERLSLSGVGVKGLKLKP